MDKHEYIAKITSDILTTEDNAAIFLITVETTGGVMSCYSASILDNINAINVLISQLITSSSSAEDAIELLNDAMPKMIAKSLLQTTGQLEV